MSTSSRGSKKTASRAVNRKTTTVLVLIVAGTAMARSSSAQESGTTIVELHTNAPHASVYVDDALIGRASQRYFIVPSGSDKIRLVVGGRENWSIPPASARLSDFAQTDTVSITVDFPYRYRFESKPFGARVLAGSAERPMGFTPFETTTELPLSGPVTFELEGYWPEAIDPGSDIWNVHAVRLRPIDPNEESAAWIALSPPRERRKWIDYAALGTAAVAGVVAVHYKFKADRRYDRYRESGDPSIRTEVKRFDVYSGVALGVMQAGIGLFTIRLVLR